MVAKGRGRSGRRRKWKEWYQKKEVEVVAEEIGRDGSRRKR